MALLARAPSFFEEEYYLEAAGGGLWKLPVPLTAQLQGYSHGMLLLTLRDDWTPLGSAKIAKGALHCRFAGWRTEHAAAGFCPLHAGPALLDR